MFPRKSLFLLSHWKIQYNDISSLLEQKLACFTRGQCWLLETSGERSFSCWMCCTERTCMDAHHTLDLPLNVLGFWRSWEQGKEFVQGGKYGQKRCRGSCVSFLLLLLPCFMLPILASDSSVPSRPLPLWWTISEVGLKNHNGLTWLSNMWLYS